MKWEGNKEKVNTLGKDGNVSTTQHVIVDESGSDSKVSQCIGEGCEQKEGVSSKKKGRGCFFWGCMGCLGFGVLIFILTAIAIWFGYNKLGGVVVEWTTETPIKIEKIETSENAKKIATQRADVQEKIKSGEIKSFTITQDLINALISTGEISDYMSIQLGTGDDVTLKISAPLDKLERDKVKGRYFNFIINGTYKYENGGTEAYIHHLEIPGKNIPKAFLDKLLEQNLGPYFYKDNKYAENMQQFKSIIFSGGRVYVEMK